MTSWRETALAATDIASIPPPDAQADPQEVHETLQSLVESHPNDRFALLRLASYALPDVYWSDIALDWAKAELQDEGIEQYIKSGLTSGTFKPEVFFDTPLLLSWAHDHPVPFLDAFNTVLVSSPAKRFDTVQVLLKWLNPTITYYALPSHPAFLSLLHSLLFDTGNKLFPLAIRCFICILPYAPSLITPHIPLLMIIFGRVASWRDRPLVDEGSRRDGVTRTPKPASDWKIATSAMEPKVDLPDSLSPRNLSRLFSVAMYNGWPSNVLAFVRNPASYITGKNIEPLYNVPWEEVWEPGQLAIRVGTLLRDFYLHPALVYHTSQTELEDEKRFDKMDPEEFIARSHILGRSGDVESGLNQAGQPLQAESTESSGLMSGIEGDDQADARGSAEAAPEQKTTTTAADADGVSRELQLLRLEMQFATRLRKQYLHHISRLHKSTVRFNSDEAEIHSFVNKLKEQGKTIATLTAELSQQRADAAQAQSKHVKWQEQLREKLAGYREERRIWQAESARIRGELSEAQAMVARQKEDIAEIKNERFSLQAKLAEIGPKVQHIEDYETRMKQLTDCQKLWDDDVKRYKQAVDEVEHWRAKVYKVEALLRAVEAQREEREVKIGQLERELSCAKSPILPKQMERLSPDMDFYINIADNAKRRVEALERENLELRAQLERKAEVPAVDEKKEGGREFIW